METEDKSAPFTEVLRAARGGDTEAEHQLWDLAYKRLKHLAHGLRRRGGPAPTSSTTTIVHELYLKLGNPNQLNVADRNHFFALACKAMRQILVQAYRRRGASKRGGSGNVTLDTGGHALQPPDLDLIALDQALECLAGLAPRLVKVVECRFFGGLSREMTAEVLAVSPTTLDRDWIRAKTYLFQLLKEIEGTAKKEQFQ